MMDDSRRVPWHGLWGGVALFCLLSVHELSAAPIQRQGNEEISVRVYKQVVPSTVFLFTSYVTGTNRNSRIGSGFFVDEAGTVLTNAHVVEGVRSISARLYDGRIVRVEVVGIDDYSDVAVLRLAGSTEKAVPVRLGTSEHLEIGQQTHVIGNPFGLGFGLTTGILSGLNRIPPGLNFSEPRVPLLQTTAPINPGDSGGPLVDAEGRVIGITTSMLMGTQNIGFAVPIDIAKAVLAEIKAKGRVARPWIGVAGKFVTESIRELFVMPLADGLLVEDVVPGSPAAVADIRAGTLDVVVAGEPWMIGGDLIVSVLGKPLPSMKDFVDVLQTIKIGDTVTVELIRDRVWMTTSVTVGERPQGVRRHHGEPPRPPGGSFPNSP